MLKEIGVDVLHDGARQIMKERGADVRDGVERVHFDSDLILDLIAHCPSEFTLHARNPAHNVRFGGNNLIISHDGVGAELLGYATAAAGRATSRTTAISCELAQMHNILS